MESKERKEHLEKMKYRPGILSNIEKLMHKFDKHAKPVLRRGYIFCDETDGFFADRKGNREENITKNKDKRRIYFPKSKYHKQRFDRVLKELEKDLIAGYYLQKNLKAYLKKEGRAKKLTTEEREILLDQEQAEEILAQEYKIHLMPKEDYMLSVANKIFEACERDPELRDLIYDLKFKHNVMGKWGDGVVHEKQPLPNIVIYPRLGRENFIKLTKKLNDLFSRYDLDEISTGTLPRYSMRSDLSNPLTCYAQGGGDLKNAILAAHPDMADIFLTERQVHFGWSTPPTLSSDDIGDIGDTKRHLDEPNEYRNESGAPSDEFREERAAYDAYMAGETDEEPDWSSEFLAAKRERRDESDKYSDLTSPAPKTKGKKPRK